MLRQTLLFAAALTVLSATDPAYAQSGDRTAPVTARPDRTTADPATRKQMQEKRAAARLKRNACIKEFKAQKISLLRRSKFINECMTKS